MDPGDYYRIFRGFLGLTQPPTFGDKDRSTLQNEDLMREENDGYREGSRNQHTPFNFNVFTDPLGRYAQLDKKKSVIKA